MVSDDEPPLLSSSGSREPSVEVKASFIDRSWSKWLAALAALITLATGAIAIKTYFNQEHCGREALPDCEITFRWPSEHGDVVTAVLTVARGESGPVPVHNGTDIMVYCPRCPTKGNRLEVYTHNGGYYLFEGVTLDSSERLVQLTVDGATESQTRIPISPAEVDLDEETTGFFPPSDTDGDIPTESETGTGSSIVTSVPPPTPEENPCQKIENQLKSARELYRGKGDVPEALKEALNILDAAQKQTQRGGVCRSRQLRQEILETKFDALAGTKDYSATSEVARVYLVEFPNGKRVATIKDVYCNLNRDDHLCSSH
jgi:hypothetical protein